MTPQAAPDGIAATETRMKPSSGKVRRRLHLLPYLLALPIVIYEGIFIVSPIVQGIYGSFTRLELGAGRL